MKATKPRVFAGMRFVCCALTALSCVVVAASATVVHAQAKAPSPADTTPTTIAAPAAGSVSEPSASSRANGPAAPLTAIVRGFFVGTRFGVGYMALRQKIDDSKNWPVLTQQKKDEGYGIGTMLQLEVGYDITPMVAIEALGGAALVNGTRKDRVRDIGVMFGGVGLRVAPAIGERIRATIAGGGGYASADDAVEAAQNGPLVFLNAGIEYYAHIRHFSVGLDLSVLCPVQPLRLFVSLGPQVKYTF